MGWSTSVISPPDGNMKDYLDSLHLLLHRPDQHYWPTHGPVIPNPQQFVQSFIDHRAHREAQILDCLRQDIARIPDMVQSMYRDIDPRLHVPAGYSVLAHLIHLVEKEQVSFADNLSIKGEFFLRG